MYEINRFRRLTQALVHFVIDRASLIAPHISLHDPPYHKTMKKYEDFEGMVVSLLHPRKIRDSNMVL